MAESSAPLTNPAVASATSPAGVPPAAEAQPLSSSGATGGVAAAPASDAGEVPKELQGVVGTAGYAPYHERAHTRCPSGGILPLAWSSMRYASTLIMQTETSTLLLLLMRRGVGDIRMAGSQVYEWNPETSQWTQLEQVQR
jgi:hypothetical protein